MKNLLVVIFCVFGVAQSDTQQSGSYSNGNNNNLNEQQNGFAPLSPPYPSSALVQKSASPDYQVIDNPAYDPNIYQTFVPQDAVQQYVSQYGGPYPPMYGSYPDPAGFTVQTGYEGYLVPQIPQPQPVDVGFWDGLFAIGSSLGFGSLGKYFGYGSIAPGVKSIIPVSQTFLSLLFKTVSIIFSTAAIVAIGGVITYIVCALTPSICTLNFRSLTTPFLDWTKKATKDVRDTIAGVEVSPERIKRAAEFVKNAIAKFQNMQNELNTELASTTAVEKI